MAAKRTKDARGGLTAAGRASFRRKEGAHLKPGVKKRIADMTPDEMRRKGSWAARFYGRAGKLPPLVDDKGKPTRFALTAAAAPDSRQRSSRQYRRNRSATPGSSSRARATSASPRTASPARRRAVPRP